MRTILRSKELTCPSCITKIEKALTAVNGVETAKVHFNTGRIEVQHNPELVAGEDLEKAIRAIGYEARVSAF
jgi:copper chaperone